MVPVEEFLGIRRVAIRSAIALALSLGLTLLASIVFGNSPLALAANNSYTIFQNCNGTTCSSLIMPSPTVSTNGSQTTYSGEADLNLAGDPASNRSSFSAILQATVVIDSTNPSNDSLNLVQPTDLSNAFGIQGLTIPAGTLNFSGSYSTSTQSWSVNATTSAPNLSASLSGQLGIIGTPPESVSIDFNSAITSVEISVGAANYSSTVANPWALANQASVANKVTFTPNQAAYVFTPYGATFNGVSFKAGNWALFASSDQTLSNAMLLSWDPVNQAISTTGSLTDYSVTSSPFGQAFIVTGDSGTLSANPNSVSLTSNQTGSLSFPSLLGFSQLKFTGLAAKPDLTLSGTSSNLNLNMAATLTNVAIGPIQIASLTATYTNNSSLTSLTAAGSGITGNINGVTINGSASVGLAISNTGSVTLSLSGNGTVNQAGIQFNLSGPITGDPNGGLDISLTGSASLSLPGGFGITPATSGGNDLYISIYQVGTANMNAVVNLQNALFIWGSQQIPVSGTITYANSSAQINITSPGPLNLGNFISIRHISITATVTNMNQANVSITASLQLGSSISGAFYGTLTLTGGNIPTFSLNAQFNLTFSAGGTPLLFFAALTLSGSIQNPPSPVNLTTQVSFLGNQISAVGTIQYNTSNSTWSFNLVQGPGSSTTLNMNLTYNGTVLTGTVNIGTLKACLSSGCNPGLVLNNVSSSVYFSSKVQDYVVNVGSITGAIGPLTITGGSVSILPGSISLDLSGNVILNSTVLATGNLSLSGPISVTSTGLLIGPLTGSITINFPSSNASFSGNIQVTASLGQVNDANVALQGTLNLGSTAFPVAGDINYDSSGLSFVFSVTSPVNLGNGIYLNSAVISLSTSKVLTLTGDINLLGNGNISFQGQMQLVNGAIAINLTANIQIPIDLGGFQFFEITGTITISGNLGSSLTVTGNIDFAANQLAFTGQLSVSNGTWNLSLSNVSGSTVTFTLTASYDPSTNHLIASASLSNLIFGTFSLNNVTAAVNIQPGSFVYLITASGISGTLGPITLNNGSVTITPGNIELSGNVTFVSNGTTIANASLSLSGPFAVNGSTFTMGPLSGTLNLTFPTIGVSYSGNITVTIQTGNSFSANVTLNGNVTAGSYVFPVAGQIKYSNGSVTFEFNITQPVILANGVTLTSASLAMSTAKVITFAGNVNLLGNGSISFSGQLQMVNGQPQYSLTATLNIPINLGAAGLTELIGNVTLSGVVGQSITINGEIEFFSNDIIFTGSISVNSNGIWNLTLSSVSGSTVTLSINASYDPTTNRLSANGTLSSLNLGAFNVQNITFTLLFSPGSIDFVLSATGISGKLGPITFTNSSADVTITPGQISLDASVNMYAGSILVATANMSVSGPMSFTSSSFTIGPLTGTINVDFPSIGVSFAGTIQITVQGGNTVSAQVTLQGTVTAGSFTIPVSGQINYSNNSLTFFFEVTQPVILANGVTLTSATVSMDTASVVHFTGNLNLFGNGNLSLSGQIQMVSGQPTFTLTVKLSIPIDLGGAGLSVVTGQVTFTGILGQTIYITGYLDFFSNTLDFTGSIANSGTVWTLNLTNTSSSSVKLSITATYDSSTNHLVANGTVSDLVFGSFSIQNITFSLDIQPGNINFNLSATGISGTLGPITFVNGSFSIVLTPGNISLNVSADFYAGSTLVATATMQVSGPMSITPSGFTIGPLTGTINVDFPSIGVTFAGNIQITVQGGNTVSAQVTLQGTVTAGSFTLPVSGQINYSNSTLTFYFDVTQPVDLANGVTLTSAKVWMDTASVVHFAGNLNLFGNGNLSLSGQIQMVSGQPTFTLTVTLSVPIDLGGATLAEVTGQVTFTGILGQSIYITGYLDFFGNTLDFTGSITNSGTTWTLKLTNTPSSSVTLSITATYDSSTNHLVANGTIGNLKFDTFSIQNITFSLDIQPGSVNYTITATGISGSIGPFVVTSGSITITPGNIAVQASGELVNSSGGTVATISLKVDIPFTVANGSLSFGTITGSFSVDFVNLNITASGTISLTLAQGSTPGTVSFNVNIVFGTAGNVNITGSINYTIVNGAPVFSDLDATLSVDLSLFGGNIIIKQGSTIKIVSGSVSINLAMTIFGMSGTINGSGTLSVGSSSLTLTLSNLTGNFSQGDTNLSFYIESTITVTVDSSGVTGNIVDLDMTWNNLAGTSGSATVSGTISERSSGFSYSVTVSAIVGGTLYMDGQKLFGYTLTGTLSAVGTANYVTISGWISLITPVATVTVSGVSIGIDLTNDSGTATFTNNATLTASGFISGQLSIQSGSFITVSNGTVSNYDIVIYGYFTVAGITVTNFNLSVTPAQTSGSGLFYFGLFGNIAASFIYYNSSNWSLTISSSSGTVGIISYSNLFVTLADQSGTNCVNGHVTLILGAFGTVNLTISNWTFGGGSSGSVNGFSVTIDSFTWNVQNNNAILTVTATVTVPNLGTFNVVGTYDATTGWWQLTVTGQGPFTILGFSVTNVDITWNANALTVKATITPSGLQSVTLSGTWNANGTWSLTVSGITWSFGGFGVSNVTITWTNTSMTISGNLVLPGFTIPVSGTIYASGSFSASGQQSVYPFGYSLQNASITFSNGGVHLNIGWLTFLGCGANVTGNWYSNGTWDISVNNVSCPNVMGFSVYIQNVTWTQSGVTISNATLSFASTSITVNGWYAANGTWDLSGVGTLNFGWILGSASVDWTQTELVVNYATLSIGPLYAVASGYYKANGPVYDFNLSASLLIPNVTVSSLTASLTSWSGLTWSGKIQFKVVTGSGTTYPTVTFNGHIDTSGNDSGTGTTGLGGIGGYKVSISGGSIHLSNSDITGSGTIVIAFDGSDMANLPFNFDYVLNTGYFSGSINGSGQTICSPSYVVCIYSPTASWAGGELFLSAGYISVVVYSNSITLVATVNNVSGFFDDYNGWYFALGASDASVGATFGAYNITVSMSQPSISGSSYEDLTLYIPYLTGSLTASQYVNDCYPNCSSTVQGQNGTIYFNAYSSYVDLNNPTSSNTFVGINVTSGSSMTVENEGTDNYCTSAATSYYYMSVSGLSGTINWSGSSISGQINVSSSSAWGGNPNVLGGVCDISIAVNYIKISANIPTLTATIDVNYNILWTNHDNITTISLN